jgi:hypothetical protein
VRSGELKDERFTLACPLLNQRSTDTFTSGISPAVQQHKSSRFKAKLAASRGTFSYDDDREKVITVLHKMSRAKATSLFKRGDLLFARLFQIVAPWFCGEVDKIGPTLDQAPDLTADDESRPAEETSIGAAAVERIKRRVGWRDDVTEAAFINETGINLLSFAAAFDDLEACRHLCSRPDAASLMAVKAKKIKLKDTKKFPHRKLPGAHMLTHEELLDPLGYAVA